jgi:hypothetical protein
VWLTAEQNSEKRRSGRLIAGFRDSVLGSKENVTEPQQQPPANSMRFVFFLFLNWFRIPTVFLTFRAAIRKILSNFFESRASQQDLIQKHVLHEGSHFFFFFLFAELFFFSFSLQNSTVKNPLNLEKKWLLKS